MTGETDWPFDEPQKYGAEAAAADAAEDAVQEEDVPAAGFEAAEFDGRLFAALELVRRAWVAVREGIAILLLPFGVLLHLPQILSEAGLIHAPGRRVRNLVLALPAAAVFLGTAGVAIAGMVTGGRRAEDYRAAARAAEGQKDDEAARVFFGREFDLDGSAEALFGLGSSLERLGRLGEAGSVMRRAADEFGYGEAHIGLADRTLADPAAMRDPAKVAEAVDHLRSAEEDGVPRDEVAPKMAKALVAGGDFAGAVPYLERAAATDVARRLDLAAVYMRLGRGEDARAATVAAEGELRRRVEEQPGDVEARARWVTCLLNLGKPKEAIAAIDAAGQGERPAVLDELFVLACLACERELAATEADPTERLGLIRRALEARPRSEPVLLRLIAFAEDPKSGGAAAEAARLRDAALSAEGVPAGVWGDLGQRAWAAGDEATARRDLERAYALDPSNVVVANNLAWVLVRGRSPDAERAVSIASALVKQWPNVVQFRDTRGQTLAKLGRWREALGDLERALSGMKGSVETRRTLAEAYRRAGQPKLAELQEREADRIEAAKKAGPSDDGAEARPGS
jgi:tetratricopeptide (TPR) repeat protein